MTGIVWENPPVPSNGGRVGGILKYAALAAELKAKPGVWARIGEFDRDTKAGSLALTVRDGFSGFAPSGAFEATQRTIKPGPPGEKVVRVYARYVGETGGDQ